jgi:hypothetical protein
MAVEHIDSPLPESKHAWYDGIKLHENWMRHGVNETTKREVRHFWVPREFGIIA